MKRLVLLLALAATPAFAQTAAPPTALDLMGQTVANYAKENAVLAAELLALRQKNAELTKQLGKPADGNGAPAK